MLAKSFAFVALFGSILPCAFAAKADATYPLTVLPPEGKSMTDPETGAELTFLTTNPADDQNLYYEQRSWLADSSLILFNSSRADGGLMGYLTATGELVRLTTPKGGLGGATAARDRNSVFAVRGADIVELALDIRPSSDPAHTPSTVTATERVIATLAENQQPTNTSLTENANGKLLAVGVGGRSISTVQADGKVVTINVKTGKIRELCHMPGKDFSGHVVFSRHNPDLVSFCAGNAWLTAMNVKTGEIVFNHKKVPGEFATHHCWWVGDTITFCGGFHSQPTEDADVKVIDIHSGEVRIVGKGAWWPEAKSIELARLNWWHSCGLE